MSCLAALARVVASGDASCQKISSSTWLVWVISPSFSHTCFRCRCRRLCPGSLPGRCQGNPHDGISKSSPFPLVTARPCGYQATPAALPPSQDTVLKSAGQSEKRGCTGGLSCCSARRFFFHVTAENGPAPLNIRNLINSVCLMLAVGKVKPLHLHPEAKRTPTTHAWAPQGGRRGPSR